ncbi:MULTISPECIES: cysteine hydrolase family protein [unclassified Sphingopyxis]|uniref:cysteine hydrolase family protein n=1 Tax=unclassified Sphingopyxis TaxID=2614943 RepID=UPI0009E666B5|nr:MULTISPECIES: isochorismatase family cysteine hydrolase [unclassified Sphingopyxis]
MSHTVLLALHYQNEVMHGAGRIRLGTRDDTRRAELVAAAHALLAGARAASVPVVHVRIAFPKGHEGVLTNAPIFRNVVASGAMEEGSWGAEFFDGLEPRGGEAVVTHGRVNAFFESSLEETLRGLDAGRLIVAGVATNSVVEHSVRHAADMGYDVVVAADACSAADPAVHAAALFNLSLVAEVSAVDDIFPGVAA